MTLLLDTHAFLWAVMQPEKLSGFVRKRLEDSSTHVVISAASAWEIATKFRLGRLPDARPIMEDFDAVLRRFDAKLLPINHRHALLAGSFPQPHADPFDRMLAAQSRLEHLPLVSKDPALKQFDIDLIW